MAENLGDVIQNKLVDAALAFDFPTVSYDPDTHRRTTSDSETKKPKSYEAWDSSALWDDAPNYRRGGTPVDRGPWTWFLTIQFSVTVSTEEFERSLATNPPRVLRAESPFGRQVDLLLREAEYERPSRQQPSAGTKATYRFEAVQTPR